MKNNLIKYFNQIMQLSEEEENTISESMLVKHFSKETIIQKEGEESTKTYFILEGCIREYSIIDGNEKTTNFFTENQWVISLNSFEQNNLSLVNWICYEDCTLVVGNEKVASELFKKYPKCETIARLVMEKTFAEYQQKITTYLTETPEQRYLRLMKEKPELFQRITQYHLASYLGVKPESLSRIRKRLSSKN